MTILAWGSAGAPLPGETISGDRVVVVELEGGALAAVIDGLGHGAEAAVASAEAARALEEDPALPLAQLVAHCHARLRRTRGAVLSLARFDPARGEMAWLGVGNVEGYLVRAQLQPALPDAAIPMRGGTVGYVLPPLVEHTVAVRPGDTLVFATDGIRPGFREEIVPVRRPQEIADAIVAHWATRTDDSCVLVARYLGEHGATRVDVEDEADIAQARIRTRGVAKAVGFAAAGVEALATAVSELARNIVVYATRGEILVGPTRRGPRRGVLIVAHDRGPGIADPARALEDGYSTGASLGCGLPGARRLVDHLELETALGQGTTVTLTKWRP